MPVYVWICDNCQKILKNTTQSFSDSDVPPEEKSCEDCEEHKWRRYFGSDSNVKVTKGARWGAGKGYW